jgi:hypothetical protein
MDRAPDATIDYSNGYKKIRTQPVEGRLPTSQRNALCQFFDRSDYTPEEVVALGYRRLQKINGIGPKGMEIITAWARFHGLELKADNSEKLGRQAQRVERAIRLLKLHGYNVLRAEGKARVKHEQET